MKPQVGFPECMIFDMAMSYFTALHDSSNLHDPWGIKIWGALGGKEDHTMPFANCMGCDFQSYNQIYNWTNMSWNCIVYFLGFPSVVVNRPRNSSVRIRCTRMSVQLWMYMLCVYCMSEWFVEICQAFNDPDTHLGRCVLFTSNAISLWCLMNQISTLQTNIKKLLHDSNTLNIVEFWSICWWFDEILCRHILVNICVLLYRGNPLKVTFNLNKTHEDFCKVIVFYFQNRLRIRRFPNDNFGENKCVFLVYFFSAITTIVL